MTSSSIGRKAFREIGRGREEGHLVFVGCCPLREVELVEVSCSLKLRPEQEAEKETVADHLRQQGMVVTDGPIFRLEGWELSPGLRLRVTPRSYFDSVLLKARPEWGLRSKVLAVVAVTECADGYLVEKRSSKVAALPGRLHPVPSGSVEPSGDPLETLHREAAEELGLEAHEMVAETCLGLVYGKRSGVFQLVSRSTTALSHREIESRECEGLWERAELLCVPKTEREFFDWLHQHDGRLTDGGRVALFMEGARRWGEHRLEEALR